MPTQKPSERRSYKGNHANKNLTRENLGFFYDSSVGLRAHRWLLNHVIIFHTWFRFSFLPRGKAFTFSFFVLVLLSCSFEIQTVAVLKRSSSFTHSLIVQNKHRIYFYSSYLTRMEIISSILSFSGIVGFMEKNYIYALKGYFILKYLNIEVNSRNSTIVSTTYTSVFFFNPALHLKARRGRVTPSCGQLRSVAIEVGGQIRRSITNFFGLGGLLRGGLRMRDDAESAGR